MSFPLSTLGALSEALDARLEEGERAFLRLAQSLPIQHTFARSSRAVRRVPVSLSAKEAERFQPALLGHTLHAWTLVDLMRAVLLLSSVEQRASEEGEALVHELFTKGDNAERQAVLRCLPLLPDAERLVPLAIEACRSNVEPVFEAIACENPFPARWFAEHNFNQMVLKAVFIGISLSRVVGLGERRNPELARMAQDYAQERRAAGRPVPDDLNFILHSDGERHEVV